MASRLIRTANAAGKTLRGAQHKGQELFVKKISWVTGAKELTDYFSQFGKISNITLPFDLRTGLHKGFAFISFENEDFDKKIKKFGAKHIIDDEEVTCSVAGEEKSLLLSDANATPLGNRKAENTSEVFNSEIDRAQGIIDNGDKETQRMNNPKSANAQRTQKQASGSKSTQKLTGTATETESRKLFGKRITSNGPVITRLTDPVKEIEGGDSSVPEKGYTVVRLSNDSKADVMKNSFKNHKGFTKRSFNSPAGVFTKGQHDEGSAYLGHVKEAELENLKDSQPKNLKMTKDAMVELAEENRA